MKFFYPSPLTFWKGLMLSYSWAWWNFFKCSKISLNSNMEGWVVFIFVEGGWEWCSVDVLLWWMPSRRRSRRLGPSKTKEGCPWRLIWLGGQVFEFRHGWLLTTIWMSEDGRNVLVVQFDAKETAEKSRPVTDKGRFSWKMDGTWWPSIWILTTDYCCQ